MSLTTTAQDIIDATSQDIRSQLSASWGDGDILLEYVDRVCQQLLRKSQWNFLLAPVQRFVTEQGQSDYWIGATGSHTQGTVDTGLNLTDVGRIKVGSVYDRSNWRPLHPTQEPPLLASATHQDVMGRPDRPLLWRQSFDTSDVLNIYPPPDNQNTYQPSLQAPILETSVSGALANRTYFVKVTLVDSIGGESAVSTAARQFIPANSVMVVKSPSLPFSKSASGITYNRYRVYASTTEGSETLQATVNIGSNHTEAGTGLVAGSALPTTITIEPLRGYVIEFRYYKTRAKVTTADQVLQIPDDYKDVVVAGTNALAYLFLRRPEEAAIWRALYDEGVRAIVSDKKLFPQGADYISPDTVASTEPDMPNQFMGVR